ncbi:MAG: 30S ribosomal protein S6 [Rhodospirillaceae bacterium]|nr:30S ribosomal protein S6 [Rhodospirillaceae bacterium]MYB14988.1 30S ribosomal protein S6 [Rhodospirillaceae bacterium]MYI47573.1 30S ribosomal protein S6 [Rhodospirillaceae bacterium]
MPYYECVYLARQDIAASQVDTLSDGFAEVIANGGGEVKKREYWGLRNLAYRVKKNRKAHYVLMNIDAPASAVQEMQRLMRLNADVLRELTLRVDALNEGPSIMMQRREERRDRGERRSRRDEERRAEKAAAENAGETEAGGKSAAAEDTSGKTAAEKEAPADSESAKKDAGKPTKKAGRKADEQTAAEDSKPAPAEAGKAADEAPAEDTAAKAAEKTAESKGGDD